MPFKLRPWTWAAGALVAGTISASAAVVDFTDTSIFTTSTPASATGSVGGFNFTVTGSSPDLTYNTTTGPGAVGGLAGETDGIGIGDDEIDGTEYVTVVFDRRVRLVGVSFLDLFRSASDAEQASLYAGVPPTPLNFVSSFAATETYAPGGAGYGSFAVSAKGTTFTFDSGAGNDAQGVGDFALASLEVVPVPVPAALVLLGTSLLGFRVLHRRRK